MGGRKSHRLYSAHRICRIDDLLKYLVVCDTLLDQGGVLPLVDLKSLMMRQVKVNIINLKALF